MKPEVFIKKTRNGHTVFFKIGVQTFGLEECKKEGKISSLYFARFNKKMLDTAFGNLLSDEDKVINIKTPQGLRDFVNSEYFKEHFKASKPYRIFIDNVYKIHGRFYENFEKTEGVNLFIDNIPYYCQDCMKDKLCMEIMSNGKCERCSNEFKI